VALLGAAGCGRKGPPAAQPVDASSAKATAVGQDTAVEGGSATDLFVDVARKAGIDFVHFNGMSGEFYICEVKCSGGGLLDYDNDGDLDIYLIQGAMLGPAKRLADATFPPNDLLPPKDRLYRNDLVVDADGRRTLRFTDVTEMSGIDSTAFGIGVTTGDYDNDGWIDIYVTTMHGNQLLHNNGDGTFTNVADKAGVQDPRYNTAAAFLDYDRDGWLDLFVAAYVNFNYATHKACLTISGRRDYPSPLNFNVLPDRLFHNRGDGTFEDVSATAHVVSEYGSGLGVVCADLNDDGWIDIYVGNDGRPNQLWINQHDGTFVNDALLSGCAVSGSGQSEASMGIDAGDFDGDGDLDLFMTHLNDETNTIYVNQGQGIFEDCSDVTGLGIPSKQYTAFGTAWFDYDNDGWLDLLVANGAVQTIEAQARANEPFPLRQLNQLFHNLGNGHFDDVSQAAGAVFELSEVSRGAAFGDVDNDGDVDILIVNNSGRPRLLINQVGNRQHWLGLRMVDAKTGRDMLGTRVMIDCPDGPPLRRDVRTGASYCSANDPRILVGLGRGSEVTRVRAYWPDGRSEEWTGLPIDQYTTLRQGSGQAITEPNNGSRLGACPPPRNVAAQGLTITNSPESATLWGGVRGGETRQIDVSRSSDS
jgi:hypothetical protein